MTEKTIVKSYRLPIAVTDIIDDLQDKATKIKKIKGDYSRTEKQEIMAQCIIEGSPIVEKKLDKILTEIKK